jgi:AmmeMemoRadiSam system protein B
MAVRNPVVAGMFYPGSAAALHKLIAGMVDRTATREDVFGAILPHAGYIYSGHVAGAAVSRIRFKDTFIIMGPNHTGRGKPFSIMTEGSWKTPFGAVAIDSEMARGLMAASSYLKEDTDAFAEEHSIEVQLPFLQFFQPDIKFVPIILASYPDPGAYLEMGDQLARALSGADRKAVIIASSDMTHYQPQAIAQKNDSRAIDAILALDPEKLYERIREYDISMCGYAPAMVMLRAANSKGAMEAELVKYATSGDVTGDRAAVVGYASILVREVRNAQKETR